MRYTNVAAYLLIAVASLLGLPELGRAQGEVVELGFGVFGESGIDAADALKSLVKVRQGVYLITIRGDCEDAFEEENQKLIEDPIINDRSRSCSVFSASSDGSVRVGRNWDNENVGSIIVTLYEPPGAYSSISFSRSIELGFGKAIALAEIRSPVIGQRLLLTPFYAMDGINEHGLCIAVAGDKESTVGPKEGAELVAVSYVIRSVLDHARTVDETVDLVEGYVPFVLDKNTLAGHLLVADSSGASAILEYADDQWLVTRADKPWQAMSTKRIHGMPDANLRTNCWRYRSMAEALEKMEGALDWQTCMAVLRGVEQKGTTWSVAYSPSARDLHFSVHKDWGTVYHLSIR
jgi:hypothetical protein